MREIAKDELNHVAGGLEIICTEDTGGEGVYGGDFLNFSEVQISGNGTAYTGSYDNPTGSVPVPSSTVACSMLGTLAATSAGLLTTATCTAASIYVTGGTTAGLCGGVGSVVGGVTGITVSNSCNDILNYK